MTISINRSGNSCGSNNPLFHVNKDNRLVGTIVKLYRDIYIVEKIADRKNSFIILGCFKTFEEAKECCEKNFQSIA